MLVNVGLMRFPKNTANRAFLAIRAIFAGGADGFIYDASDTSTLFQDSAGTTPVTAVTQPMGLMLDKHLGMQLGPELITNGGFDTDTAWVKTSNWTISGGVASFSPATATNDVMYELNKVVVGKMYKVTYDVTRITGSVVIYAGSAGSGLTRSATGSYTEYIVASGNTTLYIYAIAGFTGSVDNISVKLLDGNHALQATAAARPTWQVDANSYHYAQLLGTDDSLSCATGGGGSTGFLFCAAITHSSGGVIHTLFSDTGTNIGYEVEIDALDKLAFSAGNGVLVTTLTSTASVPSGTTTYVTCWDDGINLNLQIDGGTVESTARPVVSSGTPGYTLFKDNGLPLHHFVGSFYRGTYIKNWSGNAAQLAAIQSWVKAGAGL